MAQHNNLIKQRDEYLNASRELDNQAKVLMTAMELIRKSMPEQESLVEEVETAEPDDAGPEHKPGSIKWKTEVREIFGTHSNPHISFSTNDLLKEILNKKYVSWEIFAPNKPEWRKMIMNLSVALGSMADNQELERVAEEGEKMKWRRKK